MAVKVSETQSLADARVLVVDDEFLIGLEVESSLREAGATVLGPYLTLRTATEAAENQTFDAAVLDVRLGHDTTDSIGEVLTRRGIPFLFYSGDRSADAKSHAPAHVPFIAKPASEGMLVRAIANLLAANKETQGFGIS